MLENNLLNWFIDLSNVRIKFSEIFTKLNQIKYFAFVKFSCLKVNVMSIR